MDRKHLERKWLPRASPQWAVDGQGSAWLARMLDLAEGLPLCSFLASEVGEGVHNRLEQDGRTVPKYPRLDKMLGCR